jgi:hypothetical protein
MVSILYSATLSLTLLALLALVSLYNLKVLKPTLETLERSLKSQEQASRDQQKLLSQALNLLSSKDPIAYQMLQSATPEPMAQSVYNGPYLTGEEYELMVQEQKRMDEAWKDLEVDYGN